MINHFNLWHFTLSCFICVKLFCLYIPLSSWNVLLLYCPQYHPALGLAPIQCINIINLNTKEHRTDRTKRESNCPSFSWMALTHMYGSCLFLCKQELAMWCIILAQIPTYSQVFPIAAECCKLVCEIKTKTVALPPRSQFCCPQWVMHVSTPLGLYLVNSLMGANRYQLKWIEKPHVQFD